MSEQTGGQAVVEALAAEGTRHGFGLIGSAGMEIFDALYHRPEVAFVGVRDERTGTHMADGYARASGQAGVILAAAVIFHALIFGLADARRVVPEPLVESLMAIGVLIYAGVGVAGMLLGGNFLDYFVLDPNPVHGQHRGIFWVEVGVATTVSGVMLKIFYLFADRGNVDE